MSTGDLFDFFEKPKPEKPRERSREQPRVFTVTQLTRKIRNVLELRVGDVTIEGEVSNLRRQSSGHVYFTLKDAGAQISCVLFRSDAARVRIDLKDGIEIQLKGTISVYEPRGNYQIIGRTVQAVGQGALQVKFDELKQKLDAEGLFDSAHKCEIPKFPRTICIVTSPTGAAVRDMLNVLSRRAPWVRILIYPVRVQGDAASREIAAAVQRLSVATAPAIDTIILSRGGGSLEDLWPFNEECVARAIYDCPIPIVSAVGHEIDFTISDFTADMRAPTPSAAAELIAPDTAELLDKLETLGSKMRTRVDRTLHHWETVLDHTARSALTREPLRLLGELEQDLDYFEQSLDSRINTQFRQFERGLREAKHTLELHHPGSKLEHQAQSLELLSAKLDSSFQLQFAAQEARLDHAATAFKALGPESVFSRGFTATTDKQGNLITRTEDVEKGAQITTHFAEGSVESTVN